MKTTKLILIAFTLFAIGTFAQEKGVYLINKKHKDSIFLTENHRIKIKTSDGERIVGGFKIVDEKSISINDVIVPIDSIIKIRRASVFHAIADPVSVVFGSILLFGGVSILLEGGWLSGIGTIFIIPGIPTFIIPFSKNNHNSKDWNYQIKN